MAETSIKTELHPNNKHRNPYDFDALILANPLLSNHVIVNKYGNQSINFFDNEAVKQLNKSLLHKYYNIQYWELPQPYLVPPIPGRADYIHHVAQMMEDNNADLKNKKMPSGENISCLDIGVGANCIYPIVGVSEYGWSFVGTDIDKKAIDVAQKIVDLNPNLKNKVELRLQENPKNIFDGIIRSEEKFDLTICNPPFFSSAKEAAEANMRKNRNLKNMVNKPELNFAGKSNELWCEGGEDEFLANMIQQSRRYGNKCYWFTTLVSNESHLQNAYRALRKTKVAEVITLPMSQGNKSSRVLAWTFLNQNQQKTWIGARW
jgi:23S rRNA (adenine1618-N6)-methyltransferase